MCIKKNITEMSEDEVSFIIKDIIKPSSIDVTDMYLDYENDEIRVGVSTYCEDNEGGYFEADYVVKLNHNEIKFDDGSVNNENSLKWKCFLCARGYLDVDIIDIYTKYKEIEI